MEGDKRRRGEMGNQVGRCEKSGERRYKRDGRYMEKGHREVR